jgi:DNA ligase-1
LEAKYLVKLLSGELRIGLREGLVEDAIARVFGQSLADVAYANMLLGDIGETATRARSADLKDVGMRLFHPIKFMLATPAADLSDVARTMPEEFLVEDKFDGIRAQAHVQAERVAIYSRTMDEITHRFPELIEPLLALPSDAIIDGEIVPAQGDVILPFSELQKRLGRKNVGTQLLTAVPVVLVAYDLLYAAGKVLLDEPLAERRRLVGPIGPGEWASASVARKVVHEAAALDDEFAARERAVTKA